MEHDARRKVRVARHLGLLQWGLARDYDRTLTVFSHANNIHWNSLSPLSPYRTHLFLVLWPTIEQHHVLPSHRSFLVCILYQVGNDILTINCIFFWSVASRLNAGRAYLIVCPVRAIICDGSLRARSI